MILLRGLSLLFASSLLVGCFSTLPQYNFTEAQAEQAVRNWINCDECSDDQLHHVVIIGKDAEKILKDYIDDPDRGYARADFITQLQDQHLALKTFDTNLIISEDTWVKVHLQARDNRIKSRAAHALHIINSRTISRRELDAYRRVR